ncbi:HAD family hydrolase [Marinagarivorans algicola]|uniref:HAD family hydrolase n=1 Tax=Marinagarivorans algicola TaxID=1513270 RepID=UPI00138F5C60|nr:HAD family hydrolase [Marinagarivorans algicola]
MSISLDEYLKNNPLRPAIKAAFFDIDGTLLSLDGHYSAALKRSIACIKAMGVKTAIASGRPYFATRFLWQELGLSDAGVFCTGAQIYEPQAQREHRVHYLPQAVKQRLIQALREADIYYELYTHTGFFVERNNAPEILAVHAQHLRCEPSHCHFDAVSEPAVKLLIGANMHKDGRILQQLEAAFPECIFAYASLPAYPEWLFASIIDKNASKAAAFDYLLDYHQVSASHVISFGDAQSDMAFLSMAGIGVAMGNATAQVKAIADVVTTPVWEDGVAVALEALVT